MAKQPSKIENKNSHHFACKHGCNRTCGFPPTISQEYMDVFFATGRFEDLTF
jgi:hypothetical protein